MVNLKNLHLLITRVILAITECAATIQQCDTMGSLLHLISLF